MKTKSVKMSFIFVFLLTLCNHVTSDISTAIDNNPNYEDCNSENVNPGGKFDFEAEALCGETDAAAKKLESRSGKGVANTKNDLPCSTPLTGYQQDDPVLVRFNIPYTLS